MTFISILASPPSTFSVRNHARVMNRFARSLAVFVGLLAAFAWPPLAPPPEKQLAAQSSEQGGNDNSAPDRADHEHANEPLRSPPSPGLRNVRSATRLASAEIRPPSHDVSWSGRL